MKEIEVVVDLRPSPDSPQLILVKQKLAAEGDRLMLVGDPHEERVELGGPRVTIQVAAQGGQPYRVRRHGDRKQRRNVVP